MRNKIFWLSITILFVLVGTVGAANYTVSPSGSGSADGSDWDNCLPWSFTPSRGSSGNTYYLMEGSYSSKSLSTAADGSKIITIKKCGSGDGTCENITGYTSTEHDGQAVIAATLDIDTNYWTIDGNGSFTTPSRTSSDYGIKVAIDSTTGRNIDSSGTSYITVKYVHSYNAQQGGTCSYNGDHRNYYHLSGSYLKLQNNWFQNSFQDGVLVQGVDYVLVERNVFEGLGMLDPCTPDLHGQATRPWYPDSHVWRYNWFVDNDGQGIIGAARSGSNFRVYGNVLWMETLVSDNDPLVQGQNGGVWDYYDGTLTNIYIYNNTWVNFCDEYPAARSTRPVIWVNQGAGGYLSGDSVVHNNLYYNIGTSATLVDSDFASHSHDAYGNCDSAAGGTNVQSGLASTIFQDYSNHDFRLASATDDGLDLTGESWWNDSSNSFFGQLDYNEDMYGNTFGSDGNWDRGAYEYDEGGSGSTSPPIHRATGSFSITTN